MLLIQSWFLVYLRSRILNYGLRVLVANKITPMAFRCYRTMSEVAFATLHQNADPKGAWWSSKKLCKEKRHPIF